MSNDVKSCSSQKEQVKRTFKIAELAEKLMRTTIRNLAHSPKKFRPNYINSLNKYVVEIYESINKANYYKDFNKDKTIEYILKIKTNLYLLDDMIEILRKEDGISSDKEIEILDISGEFEYLFTPWSNKYLS